MAVPPTRSSRSASFAATARASPAAAARRGAAGGRPAAGRGGPRRGAPARSGCARPVAGPRSELLLSPPLALPPAVQGLHGRQIDGDRRDRLRRLRDDRGDLAHVPRDEVGGGRGFGVGDRLDQRRHIETFGPGLGRAGGFGGRRARRGLCRRRGFGDGRKRAPRSRRRAGNPGSPAAAPARSASAAPARAGAGAGDIGDRPRRNRPRAAGRWRRRGDEPPQHRVERRLTGGLRGFRDGGRGVRDHGNTALGAAKARRASYRIEHPACQKQIPRPPHAICGNKGGGNRGADIRVRQ